MKRLLFVGVVSVGIGLVNPVNAMKFLTTACEDALALSALPKRLRADASTYVLERNGYRKSRSGKGALVCVVNRNHPESLIPMCLDRAGTKSILPWTLKRGMMILEGKTNQDYLAARERKVAEGEVPIPSPGLTYMLSDYNYIYFGHTKRVMKVPAHMMYYAPNFTDEDIGGSRKGGIANRGLPFIIDPGVHGFMISLVERASDSGEVEQNCDGQLSRQPPGVYDQPATHAPQVAANQFFPFGESRAQETAHALKALGTHLRLRCVKAIAAKFPNAQAVQDQR